MLITLTDAVKIVGIEYRRAHHALSKNPSAPEVISYAKTKRGGRDKPMFHKSRIVEFLELVNAQINAKPPEGLTHLKQAAAIISTHANTLRKYALCPSGPEYIEFNNYMHGPQMYFDMEKLSAWFESYQAGEINLYAHREAAENVIEGVDLTLSIKFIAGVYAHRKTRLRQLVALNKARRGSPKTETIKIRFEE